MDRGIIDYTGIHLHGKLFAKTSGDFTGKLFAIESLFAKVHDPHTSHSVGLKILEILLF